jgi:3'-5' exoribonuclease
MIIELEMLQAKIAQIPNFPGEFKTLLEHLIISHHGEYEFGSPKLPMFPEALMLHYLDDLDSKMESMRAHFEREAENDSSWTTYNPSLGRTLLNTAKFLQKDEAIAAAAAASAAENPIVVKNAGNGNGSETIEPGLPVIDDII